MKNPNTDDKIRVSWSLNCALQYLNGKDKDIKLVKETAQKFLKLFDEMINDLPDPVCESCGGCASIGLDGVYEPIVNGLHKKCRIDEGFKSRNL